MALKALTQKLKIASLIPLALLSAAWTASIAGVGATASSAPHEASLPDGSGIPLDAIEAPASVPVPGQIGGAVPDGAADAVVAGADYSGIPSPAIAAYQRAAQIINASDTACNLNWELLGAIGRVESDHGRYGGNTVDLDGVSRPGIYGPQLNGENGTAKILDTDGGELDNDPVYDRAVGPMQFLPSTWAAVKVDADGDGERNPQDIDDAALAAAVYLCSGDEDLSTRAGQEASLFRYNHSQRYVDLVLRIMEAYSQGDYTSYPSGSYGGNTFYPSYSATIKQQRNEAKQEAEKPATGGTTTEPTKPKPTKPGGGDNSGSDPGTDPGGRPAVPSNPLEQVTKPLTDVIEQLADTVAALLTPAEALKVCTQQLGTLNPAGLSECVKALTQP